MDDGHRDALPGAVPDCGPRPELHGSGGSLSGRLPPLPAQSAPGALPSALHGAEQAAAAAAPDKEVWTAGADEVKEEVKAQVDAAKAQMQEELGKELTEKLGPLMAAATAAKQLVTAPVAGPPACRVFFIICALCAVGWGALSVTTSAQKTWSQKLTAMTSEYVLELPYPDLYLCLPAHFVWLYLARYERQAAPSAQNASNASAVGGGSTLPPSQLVNTNPISMRIGNFATSSEQFERVRALCGSGLTMAKMAVDSFKLKDPASREETCAYEPGEIGGPPTEPFAEVNVKLGCIFTDCESNALDPMLMRINNATLALQAALPNVTYDSAGRTPENAGFDSSQSITFKPMCLAFKAKKGAVQTHDENFQYKMLMALNWPTMDPSGPFLQAFLSAPGVPPVDDTTGQVQATQIVFPGPGMVGMAQVQLHQVKDETKGQTEFQNQYRYNMWTKILPDPVSPGATDFLSATIGFYFDSFVVQKITIRWKTSAEVYSEVGGIYAASVALLALIFAKSGRIDPVTGREMFIFKYTPGWLRTKWLSGTDQKYSDKSDDKSAA